MHGARVVVVEVVGEGDGALFVHEDLFAHEAGVLEDGDGGGGGVCLRGGGEMPIQGVQVVAGGKLDGEFGGGGGWDIVVWGWRLEVGGWREGEEVSGIWRVINNGLWIMLELKIWKEYVGNRYRKEGGGTIYAELLLRIIMSRPATIRDLKDVIVIRRAAYSVVACTSML
ncbi:hypothetical protein EAF00_010433 [Botryotinia globosa]|nr:hypothetical protein EAF00_010433 [Botryotinia globosa]